MKQMIILGALLMTLQAAPAWADSDKDKDRHAHAYSKDKDHHHEAGHAKARDRDGARDRGASGEHFGERFLPDWWPF